MISCEEAVARLWEFLDGELEHVDEDEVRQHLEICRKCYPKYDFQRAYFERLRRAEKRRSERSREIRRDLLRKVMAQVAEAEAEGR
ncbi:MAG: zf-HC2 domain-containing protein [Gemmatimonadota bacterium]|nr:zf-HC2 domain-containing protein [Gemmatimonadota bacterium]